MWAMGLSCLQVTEQETKKGRGSIREVENLSGCGVIMFSKFLVSGS